jgi:hypothetical protein
LEQRHDRKEFEIVGIVDEPTQHLRHGLDQKHPRNERGFAEVVAMALVGERKRFDAFGGFSLFHLGDSVDE